MSNLLVVGGFTESRRLLEPVAEEAVAQGLGDDASFLTFHEARQMDDEHRRKRMAGTHVLAHSAGVMTVPDASQRVSESELPERLTIVAGLEPSFLDVVSRAARFKTRQHLFGRTEHPRRAHLRVVAGNIAEAARHPLANLSALEDIIRFSTKESLAEGRLSAAVNVGNFAMAEDVFFLPVSKDAVTGVLAGSHDELLLDPAGVLGSIRSYGTTD